MATKEPKKKKAAAKKSEVEEDPVQSRVKTLISAIWSMDKWKKLQMLLIPDPVLTEDRKKYFEGTFTNASAARLRVKELDDFKQLLYAEASKIPDPAHQELIRTYIDYAIRGPQADKTYLTLLRYWFYRSPKPILPPADEARFWKIFPLRPITLTAAQKEILRELSLHIYNNSISLPQEDKIIVQNAIPVIGLNEEQVSILLDLKYNPGTVSCTGIEESGATGLILDGKNPEFVYEVLELLLSMGIDEGIKYLSTVRGPGDVTFCAPTMKAAQGKYDLMIEQLVFQPKSGVSLYNCGRCGSQDISIAQKQTRSADEPMTVACKCLACGNTWKDGG